MWSLLTPPKQEEPTNQESLCIYYIVNIQYCQLVIGIDRAKEINEKENQQKKEQKRKSH